MKRLLVTTDLSAKSKAGIYFAIQLASQTKFELTFFHTYHLLTPSAWNVTRMEEYEKEQAKLVQNKLKIFIGEIYTSLHLVPPVKNYIVQSSVFTEGSIMEYASKNNFSFICMSTRGAGKVKRLWGTNTANLINNSQIPVIAVPFTYKSAKISSILYASDLVNLNNELIKVVDFAKPIKASVELLHFTSPLEKILDSKAIEIASKHFSKYAIKLNIKNTDMVNSLITNIEISVRKIKPSIMIMFTEQNRNLFQKIFFASKSAEYTYNSKVPLLVFNKLH